MPFHIPRLNADRIVLRGRDSESMLNIAAHSLLRIMFSEAPQTSSSPRSPTKFSITIEEECDTIETGAGTVSINPCALDQFHAII